MTDNSSRKFYVGLIKKGDNYIGHTISLDSTSIVADDLPAEPKVKPANEIITTDALSFEHVCRAFVAVMESYRKFIPLTLSLAPALSSLIAQQRIGDFVKAKGLERTDLSNATNIIYELNISCYREFAVHNDDAIAALEGAKQLPEVMVIGLVSAYDAFLSQLLRVVLNKHHEIVLTSDKTIKFSELSNFSSIEDARRTLIDREIESAIRLSHHEQFSWMEERLSTKLKKDLAVWPRFIELCERRNLTTHTGGIVSNQYIANCQAHGCDIMGVKTGTKLSISTKYFSEAVSIIYEIGVKLCHVFWRKFAKEERGKADTALNELCFDLIYGRAYKVAESLLAFGADTIKTHDSDRTRRMMVINLANAIRLQKREEEAKKIIDKEDWSAASNAFKISAAAVRGDVTQVVGLMREIGRGDEPGPEGYRTWPVFRGMRTNEDFIVAFETTFGEPLISSRAVEIVAIIPDPPKVEATELAKTKN